MEFLCLCNRNCLTTQVTIPLVISVTFSMILFLSKPQLVIKLFSIINTVGFIYILITCNCIYIYNKIAIYSMNGKANLHIDLKNVILINMCLALLISNCLVSS